MMSQFASCGKRRSIACLVAALLLLPPAALPAATTAPGSGSSAPPLDLTDLGGTTREVAWREDGPAATIVFFFDPKSADCLLEMNFLDILYLRAHDFGLAVYAVEAGGRQPAEVRRSLDRYCTVYRDPAFPVLPDPAFRASRTYGVERVPVTFIMESHGVILNRIEGYDPGAAVTIVRRLEQLLARERGFLSPSLREAGIPEADEVEIEARLAAVAVRARPPAQRALGVGGQAPEFEYTDIAGLTGRWTWSEDPARSPRIVVFFGARAPVSVAALKWLDAFARRGRSAGLDVLAVEASGLSAAELQVELETIRPDNPDPTFPVVPDPAGNVVRAFGPWENLPQTYLLAGNGSVVYHTAGFNGSEAKIITGKVERAYILAGRQFPPALADGAEEGLAPREEEAPSIRKVQDRDDHFRSAIVQGDSAFLAWEFDRALSHFLAALKTQPQDLHALVRTAQIYERQGQSKAAVEYWQRVLLVRPGHPEAISKVGAPPKIR